MASSALSESYSNFDSYYQPPVINSSSLTLSKRRMAKLLGKPEALIGMQSATDVKNRAYASPSKSYNYDI